MNKRAVLAIGGNSLIIDKNRKTIPDQFDAVKQTMRHVAEMIEEGWDVVITHGNGPQVGFILRRSEIAINELHPVPLDYCGADTEGAIGYMIQKALRNEFLKKNIDREAVTVVTQVLVDQKDPAFKNPSKPIGSFVDQSTAMDRINDGQHFIEDAGRGWRRVVPSPAPKDIIEVNAIKHLIDQGFIVIAVGGGGIPVIEKKNGELRGVEAVIDKDYATGLLAASIGSDLLLISTAIEKVALNFNTPHQSWIDSMTVSQAKAYIDEGHFAPGSMLPKVKASIDFVENTGGKALITDPPNIQEALKGKTGTWIVAD